MCLQFRLLPWGGAQVIIVFRESLSFSLPGGLRDWDTRNVLDCIAIDAVVWPGQEVSLKIHKPLPV